MNRNKQRRREEGEARNAQWKTLTPKQQLEELDKRLGPGGGARRQRSILKGKVR